ncbi:MAG: hypothetical protein ACRC41_12465 [Sarcina sp.]
MRKIRVCLTFSGTIYSRVIRWFTKEKYSHVSLALEEDKNTWFSMGRTGKNKFWIVRYQEENVKERFTEWFPNTEVMILEKEVTNDVYYKIKRMLDEYARQDTKYNYAGIIGVALNKEITHKNRYFCSELVAKILQEVESLDVDTPPVLTKPMDFLNDDEFILTYEGDVNSYLNLGI